ncbi:MAG: isocitrate/isopropylmalate family dehydrogenase [Polyangiales bacterium]
MKITVATGDGIGSEVMGAVLDIFHQAGVPLEYEVVPMGKAVALSGEKSGLSREARESVESTGLLFKGPMETPAGADYKSVTLTARKLWGTFANKRVFRTLPGVPTPIANQRINLTMVRENIEDTYAAVEHMQTPDVAQCRRFITRPGSEQVHRYTFRMASRKGAKRVTCAHKAGVMKLTDGLFLDAFYDVAKEFTHLEVDDISIDGLAMRLVLDPSEFDVVVIPNLPGDILTDLAAGLVGGLAYAPSANIGDGICIFEAAHGTSPNIVGQDLANPSALLLSGTMMLRHVGLVRHADVIETALQRTLLDMHRRPDLGEPIPVFRTSSFVERMSDELRRLSVPVGETAALECHVRAEPKMWVSEAPAQSSLKGVDVFLESNVPPGALADTLGSLSDALTLTMISNRGTEVWPHGSAYTDCVNHYCIRFESNSPVEQRAVLSVLEQLAQHHTLCGAEWLREIDGTQAYSSAQGQN